MKRLILSACTLLIMTTAFSQTQKGNVLVGADLANLGLNFQEGNTRFSMSLNPKAGWFFKDNAVIGPEVAFGIVTQEGSTFINYGVGVFGRKYWGDEATNLARSTKWFAEANVGLNGSNLSGDGIENSSTNGLGIGIGPGIAYFLNENIALEALFKYNLTVGFGTAVTNNNLGIGLGFQIYLPGKQIRKIAQDPVK